MAPRANGDWPLPPLRWPLLSWPPRAWAFSCAGATPAGYEVNSPSSGSIGSFSIPPTRECWGSMRKAGTCSSIRRPVACSATSPRS